MPESALNFLGNVPTATRQRAVEILAAVEAKGHSIHHIWGMGTSAEHATGRATDFMVYVRNASGVATSIDTAAGDFIANYVIANGDRLGLVHVIWRQRIWRGPSSTSSNPKGVWEAMRDRGNPTDNHMDHPHVYFDGSAYVAPREADGVSRDEDRPAPPKPAPKPAPKPVPKPTPTGGLTVKLIDLRDVSPYVTGPGVKPMQRLLGVPADGYGGPGTRTALGAAQRRCGLVVDYIFGPATASALLAGK